MTCLHAPGSDARPLARRGFGDAVTSPAMGQSNSPVIEGNLRMGIARFCPQAVTVACAIEVGTIPSPEVRLSVIADNWLHPRGNVRSEEHTSELQSLMRLSYAVFCLKKHKIHEPVHRRNNKTININKKIRSD